ncbi:cholinesterase [Glonium stellatum]|uniref:Carboxylic ester hydrolase n=1 Tax=Glonium stellatum TaxID=574774 RepID=A0A8E2FAG2_9PEZI|nr:cholinesterase [Glonium stellatum]
MSSLIGIIAAIVVALLSIAPSAQAVPSPHSIESDLTILLHNDLYGNSSVRSEAAIVLSTPQSQAKAQSSCAAIGEKLWAPGSSTRNKDRLQFLRYLEYDPASPRFEFYRIDSGSPDNCHAISPSGEVQSVDCLAYLPALCTQSAPLSSSSSLDSSEKWQTTVSTGKQQITGYRDKLTFRFEGIRYAAQPERFTYSNLYEGSSSISALSFGPKCVQTGCSGSACSEDCLFLNIWTPYLPLDGHAPQTKLRAVMFWIHGGAFTGGTGADPTFDGGNMGSRGDVVMVTINYRLSTLGFLALNDGKTNGNYGLGDIITALDWVRAHIADFGGDPDRITIFGQSAGAASVRALLASPKAIGKYAAAIPMSNLAGSNYATTYSLYYTIPEEVSVAAEPILNATGCLDPATQLKCLRAYDPYNLTSLSAVARYIVVDGTYIVSKELELNNPGPVANVPVLMGFMRDDGGPFIGYPATTNVSQALNAQSFNATSIVSSGDFQVPQGSNGTLNAYNVTTRVATDSEFRCLDQATAYAAATNALFTDLYFYEFNRSYQMHDWDPNAPVCDAPKTSSHSYGDPSLEYFKCHSGELFFVFGTLYRQGLPSRDDLDIPFSQYALDSWTAFARSYDPNPDHDFLAARGYTNTTNMLLRSGRWESVCEDEPMLRQLQAPISLDVGFREIKQCEALGFPLDYYLTS